MHKNQSSFLSPFNDNLSAIKRCYSIPLCWCNSRSGECINFILDILFSSHIKKRIKIRNFRWILGATLLSIMFAVLFAGIIAFCRQSRKGGKTSPFQTTQNCQNPVYFCLKIRKMTKYIHKTVRNLFFVRPWLLLT